MTEPGAAPVAADLADAPRRPPWLLWLLVLVAGTTASVVAALETFRDDAARRRGDLATHVGERARVLEGRLRGVAAVLESIEGVASTSVGADLGALGRWMGTLEAGEEPWVTWAWVPGVREDGRAALEEAARAAGLDGFRVHRDAAPAEGRPGANASEVAGGRDLAPVTVGAPAARAALWAGLDLRSVPVVAEALDRAARAGAPDAPPGATVAVASGFALPQPGAPLGTGGPGVVLARRVARRDPSVARGAAADGPPSGWAVALIDASRLLGAPLEALGAVGIDLYLFDDARAERPIASRGTRLAPSDRLRPWSDLPSDAWRAEHSLRVGDRTWVLRGVPTPFHRSGAAPWITWLVLASGLLVTLLAAAAVRAASRREVGVRRAVADRTAELSRTNEVLRREIAVRRVAEASLARATDRLDVVLSSLTDGVLATDAAGRLAFVNPAAEALTGVRRDEALGRPVGEVLRLVTEARGEPVALPSVEALTAEGAGRPEATAVSLAPDGTAHPVAWRALPMNDHVGRSFGTLVLLRDLSDVRRREEAAREQEALFDAISHEVPDSLMLIDAEDPDGLGRILYANEPAARTRGWEVEELVGRTLADVTAPETGALAAERIARLRAGGTLRFEGTHRRRDGSFFPVEVTARAIRWRGRRAILAVQRDITERRKAEEDRRRLEVQAEHARRLESLRGLAGEVAHDFNNALTGILGNAELALLDLPESSAVRGRVEEVVRAGRRAAALTQQMLAWAGRSRTVRRPVRLETLVREAIARVETSVGSRVRVVLEVVGPLSTVQGDPPQLGRLVEDLVARAAGATGDRPGTVTVRLAEEDVDARWLAGAHGAPGLPAGRYVVLEVSDEGPVVEEDAQRRIFEPALGGKGGPAGADLSALPGIVRAHEGAIRLRAGAQGTTYRVVLPRAE